MILFPAVDIQEGRCVRLLQGKPEEEKVYFSEPWRAAIHWENEGALALHVVDLDAALDKGKNTNQIEEILSRVSIPLQVGGGIRDRERVEEILGLGTDRVVVGTKAVEDPDWAAAICESFEDRVVIALDAREGKVAVEGWQKTSEVGVVELARKLEEAEPAAFLYTDVHRDGMLTSPHFEGVEELIEATEVPVIASGGVSSVDDVKRLGECGADAVIVGKALYEEEFDLSAAMEIAELYPGRLSPKTEGSGRFE